ncbi:hypothetical protein E2C01_070044 [Portunus trituberculatus]|uniref:Uncharacterized protein n=1 Tax=Portunus trituberculatus TaxID=210409 RepID=A0A5B7HRN8_PORTR|nr:hypothetical protein [Portunus trituberculatus]
MRTSLEHPSRPPHPPPAELAGCGNDGGVVGRVPEKASFIGIEAKSEPDVSTAPSLNWIN